MNTDVALEAREQPAQGSLLRSGDFRLLVVSLALSAVGDFLAFTTLMLLVHDRSHSGYAVSLLMLAGAIPAVLFAPVSGLLADRLEPLKILVVVPVVQAAVTLLLAFTRGTTAIILLMFVLNTGFAITVPAIFTLLPRLVRRSQLTEGNSLLETARTLGGVLGPAVAGGLVAKWGPAPALIADSASFLVVVAAAFVLRSRGAAGRAAETAVREPEGMTLRASMEGLGFMRARPLLLLALSVVAAAGLFVGIQQVAAVFFIKDVLDAGNAGYGVLMTTWTLGILIGAAVVSRRIPPSNLVLGVIVPPLVGGALVATVAVFPSMALALGFFVVGGVANGTQAVASRSLIHHSVPEGLRGRVFAAANGIVTMTGIVSMGVGGLLVSVLHPRTAILIAGLGAGTAAAIGLVLFSAMTAERAAATAELEVLAQADR